MLTPMTPSVDPPAGTSLFDTPEEAALDGWRSTPAARARVISVEPSPNGDGLWVTVQTDGHPGFHDRDISCCSQAADGRWFETASFGG